MQILCVLRVSDWLQVKAKTVIKVGPLDKPTYK
jgi:hypothetical protein